MSTGRSLQITFWQPGKVSASSAIQFAAVSRHVPSHPFLAIYAKYFFTVRAVIFHFVTLPFNCHWSDTDVYPRKRKDNPLNYHVPGTHSLLNITVAEWLLPCTLLRLTLTMLVGTQCTHWLVLQLEHLKLASSCLETLFLNSSPSPFILHILKKEHFQYL